MISSKALRKDLVRIVVIIKKEFAIIRFGAYYEYIDKEVSYDIDSTTFSLLL